MLASAGVALLAWLAQVPDLALGLAYLGPAALLLLLLGLGRYPGERHLLSRTRPARPRATSGLREPTLRAYVLIPRGGALLASALAGRAPPLSTDSESLFIHSGGTSR